MKATIHKMVLREQLPLLVPPPYREAIVKATHPDWTYSLLLFGHNRRDVVHSAPVLKALRRLGYPPSDCVILVGAVFTQDARALASVLRPIFITLHNTYWTDESARMRPLQKDPPKHPRSLRELRIPVDPPPEEHPHGQP
ncbi:MAG TPA: hypothetical protein VNX25_06260 [Verrucomicrobiae bacterium]|nr:hypothetical protein [Verrucomicrobiae bacterium]